MNLFILFGILKILIHFALEVSASKTWTYEMRTVSSESSNPDLFHISLRIERISRGVFALSGEIKVGIDIVEGDGNEIEVHSFRSSDGVSAFKKMPFEVSRRHLYTAMNTHYKSVLMKTFKDCSDLPYFEGNFEPPLEKKTYTLDKCQITQEGLPNYLESGLYKIILSGYGDAEWQVIVTVEVEKNF